jgi:hypothetical protein
VYLDVRRNKNGTVRYRFTYYNSDGKRVRVNSALIPKFENETQALKWARKQRGLFESRTDYYRRKLRWKHQEKLHNFHKLVEKYRDWQKLRAPNTYTSNVQYLERWIFHYYLDMRKNSNIESWHRYFQEFTDWLRKPDERTRKPIEASTINNVIKTLNTFLACLGSYNLIDSMSVRKCPALPEHMLNSRSAEDLILPEERDLVIAKLRTINRGVAEFFEILWHSGMRFSELFGFPMTGLFQGRATGPLDEELRKCSIDYVGYMYLDSQPKYDDIKRKPDGTVERKPLKSCKVISPKHARIIPIRTRQLWNILARRYMQQSKLHAEGVHGPHAVNYLLFGDLEWNIANRSLKEAYEQLGTKHKSYHCCRHSFTTLLVGETRSFFLTRAITGHKKDKSFNRYLHIFEQMAMTAKQREQQIELM